MPDFRPHPLLKNGHLMTVASAFWLRSFTLPPPTDRLFQVDPESKILGHCHWQQGRDRSAPLLVLVHGLEGSSDSNYMRGIAEKAWNSGFHVIRLNQRNCGGTELLTPLVDEDTLCFLCGPPSMILEVPEILRVLGVPAGRIKTEEY